MIRKCDTCPIWFGDVFRSTECPHNTFAANDGSNQFEHHASSYRSMNKPDDLRMFESHKGRDK